MGQNGQMLDAHPATERIRRSMSVFVLRERAKVAMRVAAGCLVLVALGGALLFAATAFRWDRSVVSALATLLGGTMAWFAVIGPLWRGLRGSGDVLAHARRVEAAHPDFRGRLVALVDGGAPAGSSALYSRLAERVADAVGEVRPSVTHPLHREVGLVAFTSGFAVVLPLVLLVVAGGPRAVAAWWIRGTVPVTEARVVAATDDAVESQVGDVTLRYVYPAYTGLDPSVVLNGTGDASGPPGTRVEVEVRTAEVVSAAGLEAYGEQLEASVEEGRSIRGRFDITADAGEYRILTWVDEQASQSRAFTITPNDDLPPEVLLEQTTPVIKVALDEDFSLSWRARDDFGIERVGFEVEGTQRYQVYTSEERDAEVFDETFITPAALGLAEGDEVDLTVVAWDNDAISGSKRGASQGITLVVEGARGATEMSASRRAAILDAMLSALADHLVEPFPIGNRAGDIAAWSPVVAERYGPLQDLVDEGWERMPEGSLEHTVLDDAVQTGGDLVRFAAVAFDRGSERRVAVDDSKDLRTRRDEAVRSLENGILALDKANRNAALRQVVATAEKMDDLGKQLAEVMAAENPDTLQMLAMLDQLEAMMQQMAEQSSKLAEGSLAEYVNARSEEMKSLTDEIRKAIAEGRMDDAREMMKRLAEQLQQQAEGVRDTQQRQQGEASDTMERAAQLDKELEEIEQEQRELAEQTAEARDQSDAEQAREQAAVWEKIRLESKAAVTALRATTDQLATAGRDFGEITRSEATTMEAQQLDQSARAEDLRGARFSVRSTFQLLSGLENAFRTSRVMTRNRKGPGQDALEPIFGHLERIQQLLDQLEQQPSSPETQQATAELQEQQNKLQERMEAASEAAEELSKQMSSDSSEMGEQLDAAKQRMEEASQDLGEGKPMQAQGSQGAAAERTREAREALEKAIRQQQQQQQQGQGQGQKKRDGEDGEDERGKGNAEPPRIDVPGAEEFRTPEAYRKALLEGMEGDVPEAYKAMKKRYFEELVRQ